MRVATTVFVLVLAACGDIGVSPEDDLAIGRATATVTGSIQAADTLLAQANLSSGGLFSVAALSFSPVAPRDSIHQSGTAIYYPLPYGIIVSFTTSSDPAPGTYSITSGAATANVYDSLGLSGLVRNPADTLGSPVSARLVADSGSVTIDLANDTRWAGTYSFMAKDETGRMVTASGRFNAQRVDRIQFDRATSRPTLSPWTARQ